MKKSRIRAKRILISFIAFIMTLTMMPGLDALGEAFSGGTGSQKAYAESGGRKIVVGTAGIKKGDHIYFGDLHAGYKDGTKYPGSDTPGVEFLWRVLDTQKDNSDREGAMFLTTEKTVGEYRKNNSGRPQAVKYGKYQNNKWDGSDMSKWIDRFTANVFTSAEREAIRPVTKTDPGDVKVGRFEHTTEIYNPWTHEKQADVYTYDYFTEQDSLSAQKVFLPSFEETKKYIGTGSALKSTFEDNSRSYSWWIRGPLRREFVDHITYETPDGEESAGDAMSDQATICNMAYATSLGVHRHDRGPGVDVTDPTTADYVRPAMNIENSSVLYTAIKGEKDNTRYRSAGRVPEIGAGDARNWELTVEDPSLRDFSAEAKEMKGNDLYVTIRNFKPAENAYLCWMLTDEDGEALFLDRGGPFANVKPDLTAIEITDEMRHEGNRLYVFEEYYGGSGRTSYASPLDYIDINDHDLNYHTLSFDMNGHGSPKPEAQEVRNGSAAKKPEDPFEPGYDFTGWYKDRECTQKWDFGDAVETTMTLYAGWKVHTYTLKFSANGGSGYMSDQSRTFADSKALPDNAFSAPSSAVRFTGWNDKADGSGNNWQPGETGDITMNDNVTVTLYAQWSAGLMASFDMNGRGAPQPEAQLTDSGKNWKITEPRAPAEEGFTFGGWYGSPACNEEDAWDFGKDSLDTDTTLYAKWTGHPYTVHFDANGGSGDMPDLKRNCGDGVPLDNTFTRDGYLVTGWNTEADGSGREYPDGYNGDLTKEKDAEVTLYAQWQRVYTITFDADYTTFKDGERTKTLVTDASGRLRELYSADDLVLGQYTGFRGWGTGNRGYGVIAEDGAVFSADATLYACSSFYGAYEQTVTLDPCGGRVKPDRIVTYDPHKIDPLPDAVYEGHRFLGWYTDKNGGMKVEKGAQMSSALTLYAHWEDSPDSIYTVSFDTQGHGKAPAPAKASLKSGWKIGAPDDPADPGYEFGGWFTEDECENEWDFSDKVAEDMTLYAKWTNVSYTVRFDGNGGAGSMEDQKRVYDDGKALAANMFNRDGCAFTGWNTDADGSGKGFTDRSRENITTVSGTVTLYAQWTDEYTVHFEANGAEGTMADQNRKAGDGKALTANSFVMDGWEFTGWNTEEDGSGTAYEDGFKGDLTLISDRITLYAQWTPAYTVHYDANGGKGSVPDQERTFGDGGRLAANGFTRDGFIFEGWNTEPDGKGANYDEETEGDLRSWPGSITLYANWSPAKVFTVTLNANGGSFGGSETRTIKTDEYGFIEGFGDAPSAPPGYYGFFGWYTAKNGGMEVGDRVTFTSDTTLYANWNELPDETMDWSKPIGPFTVTYDPGWGSVDPASLQTVTRAGGDYRSNKIYIAGHPSAEYSLYTLDGWYSSPGGGVRAIPGTNEAADPRPSKFISDTTLYAHWSDPAYTVKFDANGGEGVMPDQQRRYGDGGALAGNALMKRYHHFAGWNTEPDGSGADYMDGYRGDLTFKEETLTLYAQWIKDSYTVKFDANGGDGEMSDADREPGDGKALPANGFTKTNHRFVSWNTEPDGSGRSYADGYTGDLSKKAGAEVTLYAQWKVTVRIVTFDMNGRGSPKPAPQMRGEQHDWLAKEPSPEPAERGYAFSGWYKESGCADKWDFGSDRLTEPVTELYAGWNANSYTVKFDANAPDGVSASGSMADQSRRYDDGKSLSANSFSISGRDGSGRAYTFTGWNTGADGRGRAFSDRDLQNVTDEDGAAVTLYAQWNKAQITTNELPDGRIDEDYSASLSQSGLGGTVKWMLALGELPEGVSMDAKGRISGRPSQAGSYDIVVKVTGADPSTGTEISLSRRLTLNVTQDDPEALIIEFTSGMNARWTKGSSDGLAFGISGPSAMLTGLQIDGKNLKKGRDYTYGGDDGSTSVSLVADCLGKLSERSHILTAIYNDGQEPFAYFTVLTDPVPAPQPDPDDGDDDEDVKPAPDDDKVIPGKDGTKPASGTVVDPKLPRPSIKKPAKAKKSMTVRWKKLSKAKRRKVQGIEVQYSLKKSFPDGKKTGIKKVKKTKKSVKIKKLKPKKTYYVRVRTYKKAGNVKYVSKWSKVKKVRVR